MAFNRRGAFKLLTVSAASMGLLGLSNTKAEALTNRKYRLGKLPAQPHEGLKLSDYLRPSKLPPVPENFGHETLVKDWGMLGNGPGRDNPPTAPFGAGDCAIAGPFHALQLWCAEGQKPVHADAVSTLAAYSAITGYDPKDYNQFTEDNPTDQGSDVQKVAEYWRTTGLKDADGTVHKIDAYMALEPKNLEQLWYALYLFDGVGIGIECPAEYQQAFNAGQVWDAIPHPTIDGGHLVTGVGRRGGLINLVTWGKTQLMTGAGYTQFSDEAYVYLDSEKLINSKDVNGFDKDQLIADMADLADASTYDPPTQPLPACEDQE